MPAGIMNVATQARYQAAGLPPSPLLKSPPMRLAFDLQNRCEFKRPRSSLAHRSINNRGFRHGSRRVAALPVRRQRYRPKQLVLPVESIIGDKARIKLRARRRFPGKAIVGYLKKIGDTT